MSWTSFVLIPDLILFNLASAVFSSIHSKKHAAINTAIKSIKMAPNTWNRDRRHKRDRAWPSAVILIPPIFWCSGSEANLLKKFEKGGGFFVHKPRFVDI